MTGLCLILTDCATPPVVKEVSHEEIVRRDQVVGKNLAPRFESHLRFKKDTEVSLFLRKLAETLVEPTQQLTGSSVGIWLIDNKKEKWNSYGLPGNRIYLPTGMIRKLEYENEIAAAIAIQFGHLMNKDVLKRMKETSETVKPEKDVENSNLDGLFLYQPPESSQKMDYFGPDGIFSFSEEVELGSMRAAVGILYRAGYDARGLISLWKLYQNNPKYSPYETNTINKLLEYTREEIAQFPPLRNPIVRSPSFILIKKRIEKL